MRRLLTFLLFFSVFLSFFSVPKVLAAKDPFSRPNNFFGIHILFPSELDSARDLVNSNGGDWGYVTIPIQIIDLDLEKWQAFMDRASALHIIPLVRLATQNDPLNTSVWRKPTRSDILDFANFLSSLNWPTKNKYVILFNEVNRFDEWGGDTPNPQEYAEIVDYAAQVFKERDPNFYLILSGMDAAAPNDYHKYISGLTYLETLIATSDVNQKIDGFASHSYPNPAFSQPPLEKRPVGIATYRYEYDIVNQGAPKKLPTFITETGWSNKTVSDTVISKYYQITFQDIWEKDKDKIVAITPFLLSAGGDPFQQFSFFKNGQPSDFLKTVLSMTKPKGNPDQPKPIPPLKVSENIALVSERFQPVTVTDSKPLSPFVSMYFSTIFGLR